MNLFLGQLLPFSPDFTNSLFVTLTSYYQINYSKINRDMDREWDTKENLHELPHGETVKSGAT